MADLAAAVEPEYEDFNRRDDIVINGRYKIVVSAPLTAFDTPTARAFHVVDIDAESMGAATVSDLFARVNETGLPTRDWEIDVLRDIRHPHLMRLIDIGATEFSRPGEAALVAVLERPPGGRLVAAEGARPMPFRDIRRRVMAPLCEVLKALHERNVFHRAIHHDNLFLGEQPDEGVILGDCVSSTPGHNLPPAFQPLERASTAPLGSGIGDRAADVFSFGVTIAALLAGKTPGAGSAHDDLLDARMEKGSLAALCGQFRFPKEIERPLAGMLADDPDERWTLDNVREWLTGRHVTVAADRNLEKPKRVFSFAKKEYRKPIAIAEAFNRNCSEAVSEIQSGRLEKWLASDRDRLALAESVVGLRERNAGGSSKLSNDALVSRVCMVLDPKGPIRFKGMAVSIDGIGALLTYAFIEGRQEIANNIATILEQGLPGYWIAAIDERRKAMAADTGNFMRLRQYIRTPKLGHGLERCLYELNPSLGCLHPLIAPADSRTAAALLANLDRHFSSEDGEPPWTDRHITAFLATLLHPRSDSLLASMKMPGRPEAVETVIGLALVALAQEKLGVPLLPRLTQTAGSRLYDIIDSYHSDSRRKALRAALDQQLNRGDFVALLKLLNNDELQERDRFEYYEAQDRYKRLGAEIVSLKGGASEHRVKAGRVGRKIAAWAAFMGLMAVSFLTLVGLSV